MSNSIESLACGDTPWIVVKFGGSSVVTLERWGRIEQTVRAHLHRNRRVLLVCSALASVTNRLESIAAALDAGANPRGELEQLVQLHHALTDEMQLDAALLAPELESLRAWVAEHATVPISPRARARLLAHGELLSTRVGVAFLASRGLAADRIDARELLVARSQPHELEHFLSGSCAASPCPRARARLDASGAHVVVTQGFIARDEQGETVLLGRGGSDASAAYLAAAVGAEAVEIRSDVPGLFTVDPRVCGGARLLQRVSYAEAEALGALGAKALHPRTIEPLRELGIPLQLGATDRPELCGTRVTRARAPRGVKAVAVRRQLALVVMARPSRFQPIGFMADVAARFERRGLSMDLVTTSSSEIRATVDLAAFPSALDQLDQLIAELGEVCRPRVLRCVGSVSLVGTGLAPLGVPCPQLLDTLSRLHVHLAVHGANGTHVTYVVERDQVDDLMIAAHRALLAARAPDDVFGPSWEQLVATPVTENPSPRTREQEVAA